MATPLVRERDYSEQEKERLKFDNEIQEMDFQKKAKEIDFIEKEMTGVKVNIRCNDSHREALSILLPTVLVP